MPRPKKPSGAAINYTPAIECSKILSRDGINKTAFIDAAVLHYFKFQEQGSVIVSLLELEAVKEMANKL